MLNFYLFVITALSAENALGSNCNLQFLQDLVAPMHEGLATPKDRLQIERWFDDPAVSEAEASLRTFDLILQKRLTVLPEPFRKKLRPKIASVIEKRESVVTNQSVNGVYHVREDRIVILNPTKLFSTPLEYSTLLHEVEHAVQKYVAESASNAEIGKMFQARYGFEQEYGAMVAEWTYLNALPETIRLKLVESAKLLPISPFNLKFIERRFQNANQTAAEYLEAEWRAGRYSELSFHEEEDVVYADLSEVIGKKGMIAIKAGASLVAYFSSCTYLLKNHRESYYYRHVCQPVFGLPGAHRKSVSRAKFNSAELKSSSERK